MARPAAPLVLVLVLAVLALMAASPGWAAVRSRRAVSVVDRLTRPRGPGLSSPPLFRYYVLDRSGSVERTFLSPHSLAGPAPADSRLPQLDSVVATIGTIVNAEVASMGAPGQSTVAPQVVRRPGQEPAQGALQVVRRPGQEPAQGAPQVMRRPGQEPAQGALQSAPVAGGAAVQPGGVVNAASAPTGEEATLTAEQSQSVEAQQEDEYSWEDHAGRVTLPLASHQNSAAPELVSSSASASPALLSTPNSPQPEVAFSQSFTRPAPRPSASSPVATLSQAEVELLSKLNVALLADPEVAMTTEVPLGEMAYMQTQRTTPSRVHFFVPSSPTAADGPAAGPLEPLPLEALEGRVSDQREPISAYPHSSPVRSPVMTGITGGGLRPFSAQELQGLQHHQQEAGQTEPLPLHPVVDGQFSPYLFHSVASRFISDAVGAGAGLGDGAGAGGANQEQSKEGSRNTHEATAETQKAEEADQEISSPVINRETISPDHVNTMENLMQFLSETRTPSDQLTENPEQTVAGSSTTSKTADRKGTPDSSVASAAAGETLFEEDRVGGSSGEQASGDGPGPVGNLPTSSELQSAPSSDQSALEADDLLVVQGETPREPTAAQPAAGGPAALSGGDQRAPPGGGERSEVEVEGSGAGAVPRQPTFTLSSLFRPGVQADGGILSFSNRVSSGEDGSGESSADDQADFSGLAAAVFDGESAPSEGLLPTAGSDFTEVVQLDLAGDQSHGQSGLKESETQLVVGEASQQSDDPDHHTETATGYHGDHHEEHPAGAHHNADHHHESQHEIQHDGYYEGQQDQNHQHAEHFEGQGGHHEEHKDHHEDHEGHHGSHGSHEDHEGHHGSHGDHEGHHGSHGDHGGHHPEHHGPHDTDQVSGTGLQPPPEGSLGLEDTLLNVDEQTSTFVDNNNRLALSMYRNLAPDYRKQNLVMSPLGVSSSLALLFLGARGETADELDKLLKLDSMTSFNPHVGYYKFLRYMNQRGPSVSTALCNMLIKHADQGDMFSGYKFLLSRFYQPIIKTDVDLTAAGSTIQESINMCVDNVTQGQMGNFVQDAQQLPAVGPSLVTVSGTFFNASLSPSLEVQPVDMTFIRFPSALRRVLATAGLRVRGRVPAGYSPELDCTVAALPYAGGQLQLLLLLPGAGGRFSANGLAQLEARLTPDAWRQLARAASPQPVEVTLPIVSHRTEADLRPLVARMGVRTAAEQGSADFSGVNGLRDLTLGGLLQLTEFHLGDGSVLKAGHAGVGDHGGHGGHGDHGDHGEHGAHGDHGTHGEHGDHGTHGEHGDHGHHGDHGLHGDHGEHGEDGNHGEHGGHEEHVAHRGHGTNEDHGDHTDHGDHVMHDEHSGHGSHGDHGDHGEHGKHGGHDNSGDHSSSAMTDDSLTFPTLPAPTFSGRGGRSQWTVGPERLPWERPSPDQQRPDPAKLAPRTPVTSLKFERAFLYAVRHEATGAILLMGRYLDPYSFV